jgi:hypothetical protein
VRSVADDLRRESLRATRERLPEARLVTALRLGDSDVALRRARTGDSDAAARLTLARQRARGRRPSGCADR